MKHVVVPLVALGAILVAPLSKAEPEIKGTPAELKTYLQADTRTVTISDDATEKAFSDRALITLTVNTENKLLAEALKANEALRQSATAALVKSGLPVDDIRSSKFSTSPQYGWFGSKPTSYKVTNAMVVTVTNEAQFQVVAGISDQFKEIQLSGTRFENSKEEEHKAKARKSALEKITKARQFYEQELGLKLRPISFSSDEIGGPPSQVEEIVVTARKSGPSSDEYVPLPEGFDEIRYRAKVTVTFEVKPADEKK